MKAFYITYMGITEPLQYSQVFSYLKGLSQKGISVYLFSFEKTRFLTKNNIDRIRKELNDSKITWFFLKYHKRPQFLAKGWDVVRGMLLSLFITVSQKIDVIHARNTMCAFIGILPLIVLRKRLIFDIRGFMAEEYVDANLWSRDSLVYKVVTGLEEYFIRRADEIVVLNKRTKDLLLDNHGVKNVTVLPTCVNLESFVVGETPTKRFTIVYVGSIGTWYMLKEMVDFYNVMLGLDKTATFLILSQTDKKVIEQNIPKSIRSKIVINTVNPKEVPYYLNSAEMGIFFIKSCFSKTASCPTKFSEYLACGLPVIINGNIGDTERVVKENRIGVVVNNFSIPEYKKAIYQLKGLLKEGNELKNRCRKVAEKYFSLEHGVDKYFKIYKRLE